MCVNVKILENFVNLPVSKHREKCHGFYIKPTKDSYTINDCPVWTIIGTPLNMIDLGNSEKYLGISVDPWTGFADSGLSEKLED